MNLLESLLPIGMRTRSLSQTDSTPIHTIHTNTNQHILHSSSLSLLLLPFFFSIYCIFSGRCA